MLGRKKEVGRSDKQASPGTLSKSTSGGDDGMKPGEWASNQRRHGPTWPGGRRSGLLSLGSAPLHPLAPQSRSSWGKMSASLPALIPRSAPPAYRTHCPRPPPAPSDRIQAVSQSPCPKVTSPPLLQLPTQKPPCPLRSTAGTGNVPREVGGGKLRGGDGVAGDRFQATADSGSLVGPDG